MNGLRQTSSTKLSIFGRINRVAVLQTSLFWLSLSLSVAHLLYGYFASCTWCDTTRVSKNGIGESVLHLSVYQPAVFRTVHKKAMADIKGGGGAREWKIEFAFLPSYPFVCLPFLKSQRNIHLALPPLLHLLPSHSLKDRTRNDYLCPEISGPDFSVNSFGKQMLIHHISLTRIQNWLPWH